MSSSTTFTDVWCWFQCLFSVPASFTLTPNLPLNCSLPYSCNQLDENCSCDASKMAITSTATKHFPWQFPGLTYGEVILKVQTLPINFGGKSFWNPINIGRVKNGSYKSLKISPRLQLLSNCIIRQQKAASFIIHDIHNLHGWFALCRNNSHPPPPHPWQNHHYQCISDIHIVFFLFLTAWSSKVHETMIQLPNNPV